MRVSSVRIKVLLILSLAAAVSSAQIADRRTDNPWSPLLIKGVPFTATWQLSTWNHGTLTSQTRVQVARADDGRTYSAILAAEGLPYEIDIDDLPNNRMITLYPRNQNYRFSTPLGGKFHTLSLEDLSKSLEQLQEGDAQGVKSSWVRRSSLGVKQEDGMTLYGHKEEWQIAPNDISERWFSSDLGVKASVKWTSPTGETIEFDVLHDVRRVEPDSALFQIPEGYSEIK